jgi:hypothetical protein
MHANFQSVPRFLCSASYAFIATEQREFLLKGFLLIKSGFTVDAKGFCDPKNGFAPDANGFCDRKKAMHLMQRGFAIEKWLCT